MKFDRLEMAAKTANLWRAIQVEEKNKSAEIVKNQMFHQHLLLRGFLDQHAAYSQGSVLKCTANTLSNIEKTFLEQHDAIEKRMRLYVIGAGNVGKSTLINALIGRELAKVDFKPATRRKDVFSADIPDGKAVLRYMDGETKTVTTDVAKVCASEEDAKIIEGEKRAIAEYNTTQKATPNLKSEQKIEIKKECEKKYHYPQEIDEIRWHTDECGILSQCVLIDTPGMNQQRGSKANLCEPSDYKNASAILWLIDANSLSSQNPIQMLDEFLAENKEFEMDKEQLRDKIIIVINRIDTIDKDKSEGMLSDAKKKFACKCACMVGISAKTAFKAKVNNDGEQIKKSNIKALENAINEVFLNKSNDIIINSQKALLRGATNRAIKELLDFIELADEKHDYFTRKSANLRDELHEMQRQIKNSIQQCIDLHIAMIEDDLRNLVGFTRKPDSLEVQRVFRASELSDSLQNVVNSLYHDSELAFERWHDSEDSRYQIQEYKYLKNNYAFKVSAPSINVSAPDISNHDFGGAMSKVSYDLGSLAQEAWKALKDKFNVKVRQDKFVAKCRSSCINETLNIRNELVDGLIHANSSAYAILSDAFTRQVCEPENVEALMEACNALIGLLQQKPPVITLSDILYIRKAV